MWGKKSKKDKKQIEQKEFEQQPAIDINDEGIDELEETISASEDMLTTKKIDVELEIIKQKLISSTDSSSSFMTTQENLYAIDLVEVIYKFSPYHTPIELLQALNTGDIVLNVNLSQLENPRWSPDKSMSMEYDENGRPITTDDKLKVNCNSWDDIFTQLEKQAELEQAETGNWILKVGFPAIRGYWKKGNSYTTYNAPLIFASAKIQYNSIDDIVLTIKGRSFDINPSIATILSINKKMLFETKLFGPTEEINLERLLNGYAKLGILFDLAPMNAPFERCAFVNRQQLLSSFQNTQVSSYIAPTISIGLYDIYSNAVFWDFNEILQKDPVGLGRLLEPKTNLMFNYKKFVDDFRSNDIYLFTNIDIVQQLCVGRSLCGDTLIQGPPGTGKSETICNILVNIALNNKTALVVSSKKTALDVVMNRLGDYSPIACHFATKKKEHEYFYNQFDKMYQRFINIRNQMDDEAIDEVVNRVTTEKLFEDVYEDYSLTKKFYDTKVAYNSKEYTIQQLISYADPNDISILERHNLKTRGDVVGFLKNYQEDASSEKFGITNLLNRFQGFVEKLNPSIDANLDYIKRLCDFLNNYNGYDKRLVIVAYLLDNQIIDFEEYKKVQPLIGNTDADASALTSRQQRWLRVCNEVDLSPLITLVESYYSVISSTNSKFDIPANLRIFASWYVFVNPDVKIYLKEFNDKESKIDRKTDIYLDRLNESIKETKLLLDRLIFLKFINTIREYSNEFLNVLRQKNAYNPRPSSVIVKQNFAMLKCLYPIHVCAVADVSSLIPCEHNMYDYLVCDEASQVEVEKALPSMYRAKKYVIAGDTKQLQPSSVFKEKVEIKTSVATNSKYAQDLDDATKAASIMQYYESRASTNVMLMYHYRSEFSELIDFSNQVFYENKLKLVSKSMPFQNPILIHRVNGLWANSCNVIEANAIYQRIYQLSQSEDYERSLGVITFNATQQKVIQELLDKTSSPRIKEWMERKSDNGSNIGIFVQNIENVQGDERDIILFSIGYDKTVSNYGSLSTQADGPNRINVAITRAKYRMELFQSEDASQYRGSSSTAKGPRIFTAWIRWASNMSYACATKYSVANSYPLFTSRIDKDIYEFISGQLPGDYSVVYNQMQGTFMVNFTIFKGITPVAAIFNKWGNWKSCGKFREEYIYRKLFFKNRKWRLFDISNLAWQTDQNYKSRLSNFIQTLIADIQSGGVFNNNQQQQAQQAATDVSSDNASNEPGTNGPMVAVDINLDEFNNPDLAAGQQAGAPGQQMGGSSDGSMRRMSR